MSATAPVAGATAVKPEPQATGVPATPPAPPPVPAPPKASEVPASTPAAETTPVPTTAVAPETRSLRDLRLPPQGQAAQESVETDKYDVDSWRLLCELAQSLPVDDARVVFDAFLAVFPSAGRYWMSYATFEENHNNHDEAAAVLKRALAHTVNVDVWKYYVEYTIRQSGLKGARTAEKLKSARAAVSSAYELALDKVGTGMSSGPLWAAYISFVAEAPETVHFEKVKKLETLRRAYKRAVTTPTHMVETLWSRYQKFENELGDASSNDLVRQLAGPHRETRIVYGELRSLWDGITHASLAVPPERSATQALQLVKWRRLVAFEQGNPLHLADEAHQARVRFIFAQSLDCLRFYPEIWLALAEFENTVKMFAKEGDVLKRAVAALPESHLLWFALADYYEERGETPKADAVYKRCIDAVPAPLVFILYQRFCRRTQGKAAARKAFRLAREHPKHCSHHVFIDAALVEFHANKNETVARNIFQLGLRRFQAQPEFVLHYAQFLAWAHDDTNLRLLFEKVLPGMSEIDAAPVWERFLRFETRQAARGGNVKAFRQVEKRYLEAYDAMPEFTKSGFGVPGASRMHRHLALGLAPSGSVDKQCLERLAIRSVDPLTGTSNGRRVGISLLGADVSRTASRKVKNTVNVPPFMRTLYAKLPDEFHGIGPDPDYVLQCIKQMDVGPPPQNKSGGSVPHKRPRDESHTRSDPGAGRPTTRRRVNVYQERKLHH